MVKAKILRPKFRIFNKSKSLIKDLLLRMIDDEMMKHTHTTPLKTTLAVVPMLPSLHTG